MFTSKLPQAARSKFTNDRQNFLVSISILALHRYAVSRISSTNLISEMKSRLRLRSFAWESKKCDEEYVTKRERHCSCKRVDQFLRECPIARETTIHIEIAGNTDTSIRKPPCPSDKYLYTRVSPPRIITDISRRLIIVIEKLWSAHSLTYSHLLHLELPFHFISQNQVTVRISSTPSNISKSFPHDFVIWWHFLIWCFSTSLHLWNFFVHKFLDYIIFSAATKF